MGQTDLEFRRFCQHEFDLRVGIGHELLQDIRNAASIGYRFSNLQSAHWGIEAYQELTPAQKKAAAKKDNIISRYIHNWQRLQHLLDSGRIPPDEHSSRLRGLQKLDRAKDTKYFAPEGHQATAFMGHLNNNEHISWIWTVPMLGVVPSNDKQALHHALSEWIDECEISLEF